MSEKMTTVAEIISQATDEGVYVNAPFEAVVRNVVPKAGKKPEKADLYDTANPNLMIECAVFGGTLRDLSGSIVRFGGKGIKVDLFRGKPQLSVGDKASVLQVGSAPAGSPTPTSTPPAQTTPPAGAKRDSNPAASFHKGMKKLALLYVHAYQYASDINVRLGGKMPPDQFQACVSSLFISSERRGAMDSVPAPREADGVGFKTFIDAHGKTPEELAAEARKAVEAAAERARAEAEAKAKAAQDEDVPF